MEIKQGYQKTKLGWIPVDWEVRTIANVARITGGYAFKSSLMTSKVSDYQIVKMSNVYQGILDLSRNPSFLSAISGKEAQFLLKKSDIILTLTGTVGKRDYGFATMIDDQSNLLLNQRLCKFNSNESMSQLFLFFLLKSENFLNAFFLLGTGGTGNQTNVGVNDIKKLILPLPPLPEQKKIAQILSTWDTAITKTKALIQKKQQLKKGLMQVLLTGKVRFEEFVEKEGVKKSKLGLIPKDWEVVKLEDVSYIDKNSLNSKTDSMYVFEYVSLSNVNKGIISEKLDCFTYKNAPSRAKRIVKKGNILFSTVRPNLQAFAIIKNDIKDVIASTGFAVIETLEVLDEKLLYHILYSNAISSQIYALVVGSNYPAINSSDVKALTIPFPPLPEQKKIAKVLSSCDQGIEKLNEELAQLQAQKKGLMQQLLTGATRVKVEA
jgi:type I restriction enzyme S subunit